MAQQQDETSLHYRRFVKEWEKQIELLHQHTDTLVIQQKELVKIPETVFAVPFVDNTPAFISIGISDAVADTALAYNMAYKRAVSVAGLMAGAKIEAINDYYSENLLLKNNSDISRFNRFCNMSPVNAFSIIKDGQIVVNRLSSGETILFIPFRLEKRKSDSVSFNNKTNLSVAETFYNSKTNTQHTITIKFKAESDTFNLMNNFYKTGNRLLTETILNKDTLSFGNAYYSYYTESIHPVPDDSLLSSCTLQHGLWPAFLYTFTRQVLQNLDKNGKYTVSGMTDNYNSKKMKKFTRIIESLQDESFFIEKFTVKNNRLYLKLTNHEN